MSTLRPFCMPKWGIEMSEGTIAEWLVAEGAAFKKGDVLCLIETAKISNEVEAERDGVLSRIVAPANGEAEPVGALLAVFGDGSEDAAALDAFVEGFVPAESTGSAGKKMTRVLLPTRRDPAAAAADAARLRSASTLRAAQRTARTARDQTQRPHGAVPQRRRGGPRRRVAAPRALH